MSNLSSLFQDIYNASDSDQKRKRVRRLWDFAVGSVHLVDRGANKRELLIKKSESQDDLFGDIVSEDDGELSVTFFDEEDVDTEKAVWTAAYMNDLPDSAFLFIEAGGEKDEGGKTTPRSIRHFPVRDTDGKLDAAHVRNAIARIPQSNAKGLTPEKMSALQDQARKLLQEITKSAPETAAETLEDITQRSLALMKMAQGGNIDSDTFAAEANAIGQMLSGISPSPQTQEEEAVQTNEIETKKMAIAQAKQPQKCAYCDEPATQGLVYNDGSEFIPVCGAHVMQGMNDLKGKDMKVESKVAMPSKAKKAEEENLEDEDPKKKKKVGTKKSDHPASASIAAAISQRVDDMAIEIEKSGRKMAKARVQKLREALVSLLELAKELDPSEAQSILASSVEKRLGMVETDGDESAGLAKSEDGTTVPDGKSSDASVKKSGAGDSEDSIQWGVDLNDASMHRDTVDKETSFFD